MNPWTHFLAKYRSLHPELSMKEAMVQGSQVYRSRSKKESAAGSAGKEKKTAQKKTSMQRLAYHFIKANPRLHLLECRARQDLRVVSVQASSLHQTPDMIKTDRAKEDFVRQMPDHLHGLLIVVRNGKDSVYCELLLKSHIAKDCKWTTPSSPANVDLPLGIKPPTTYQLGEKVVPAGTVLYHAPSQRMVRSATSPEAVKMYKNYLKKGVEGEGYPTNRVVYFGLRPLECFTRYRTDLDAEQERLFQKGVKILKKTGHNKAMRQKI